MPVINSTEKIKIIEEVKNEGNIPTIPTEKEGWDPYKAWED